MNRCVIPLPRDTATNEGHWIDTHNKYVKEAKTCDANVLFIGDSIIEQLQSSSIWDNKFKSLNCVNFGIGGDSYLVLAITNYSSHLYLLQPVLERVENVLWRVKNGEIDFRSKIKALVLFVGTNNIECTPEEIFDGILEIVKEIEQKLGDTVILLPTLLPKGQYPNPYREKNERVNILLMSTFNNADNATEKVIVVPIHKNIIRKDQTISNKTMFDYLHLTNSAYEIIFDPVYEKLRELLKK